MKNSMAAKIVVTALVLLGLGGAGFGVVNYLSASEPEPEPEPEPAPVVQVQDKAPAPVKEEKKEEPEEEEGPQLPTEPYYVAIIGNDTRLGTAEITEEQYANGNARADSMMIMRIDPTTYQVSLLTVPRDSPTRYYGKLSRLNDVYTKDGAKGICSALEQLTGVKIPYYLDMTFVQFIDFIDAIGGIDVYAPLTVSFKDIMSEDTIEIPAGEQHLNGREALVFARVRKAYAYGDAVRQMHQRHMVETMITQVATNPDLEESHLDLFLKNVETNWPAEELKLQVADFVKHADQLSFQEGTGPYDGEWSDEFGNWLCYEDPELWTAILKEFTSGGDPTQAYALAPDYAA